MKQLAFVTFISTAPIPAFANCETGPIVVSGKEAYPPISFTKDSKLVGLGYSVLTEIAQSQGLNIKAAAPAPWKRVVNNGRIGNTDIIIGLRGTNLSRDHFVFLPTPIIESAQNIFSLKGKDLKTRDDLKGLRGGVLSGTTFTPKFEAYAKENLTIAHVRTAKQNLLKLKAGRIDYFVSPLLPTIHLIETTGMKIDIQFTPTPLFSVRELIAISKKSDCINKQKIFETELKKLIQNGYIDNQFDAFSSEWNVLDYMN